MEDHDQRFKHMIRVFVREFMNLFFWLIASELDFDHIEWLDQEVFADPPPGEKGVLDLMAKYGLDVLPIVLFLKAGGLVELGNRSPLQHEFRPGTA